MKHLIVFVFSISVLAIDAQEVKEFSLKEAQEYALEHNYDMKNANTDVLIAKKRVKETLATGLPQINASISTTNYFDIPTTLLPDFITPAIFAVNENFFDLQPEAPQPETQFFPAKFGTEYNASAEVSASQLIFSGQYFVGLQASRTFLEMERMRNIKSEMDVRENVSRSYYFALVAEENFNVLDQNLESLEKMAYETREMYQLGFLEETDADQLDLMVANLQTSLQSLENQIRLSYLNLKYSMGLPLEDSIILTDELSRLLEDIDYLALLNESFNPNNNIDYRILEKQKELSFNQLRLEQVAYLPNINAFFSASGMAMRSEFNFFDTDKKWYPTTLWGVEMNIPIFSSGNRSAKVQQARMELQKMQVMDEKMQEGLDVQVRTARNNFNTAYLTYQDKSKNLEIARRIYEKTQQKYEEGVATSMDLQQNYNQYLTAQTEYVNAIFEVLDSQLKLEKILEEVN
ncbi:MAG: TolC family protein [Bacteroidales bacterium]|nr:TolC family protein [Bacteroidales bacterium]MCF8386807.1 TolC family protein [Bacteroidales bacterium]